MVLSLLILTDAENIDSLLAMGEISVLDICVMRVDRLDDCSV